MLDQEKILQFLQHTGPTIPGRVAKNIGSNILIASAHLSDLASQGKVRISSLKIGGSPLYFLPGQEGKLYPFAAGNMNPKDLRVLEKLKQQKVLREENLDVLSKLALRNLKDFAVPIHVTVGGRKQLFWRYHTLTDEETKESIKHILSFNMAMVEPEKLVEEEVVEEEILSEEPTEEEVPVEEKPTAILDEALSHEPAQEVVEEVAVVEETPEVEKKSTAILDEALSHEPAQEVVEEVAVVEETPEVEESTEIVKKVLTKEVVEEPEPDLADLFEGEEPKPKKKLKKEKQATLRKPVLQKIKERIMPKDSFHSTILDYFSRMEIAVHDTEVIRKNSELNLVVHIPTVVGDVKFYCKAKSKKKCDEKDLSSAYMEAQIKKLPLLFLYSHEINKKAQEMLESGVFVNVALKKIENGS